MSRRESLESEFAPEEGLDVMRLAFKSGRNGLFVAVFLLADVFWPPAGSALTLHEAVNLAKQQLPSFQAAAIQVQSAQALYRASYSPYLPALDFTGRQQRIFSSVDSYNYSTYDVVLSYLLFDGGKRSADKNIAKLNLQSDEQEYRKNLIDLTFNVKSAFYIALARSEILAQRENQLEYVTRDYEVAQGRNRLGVAKLSDVLQAGVRLEQARFDLVQGRGDLSNALSDLNSLVGRPLQTVFDLHGSLRFAEKLPQMTALSAVAMLRPEIKQAENQVQISKNSKSVETSSFFPKLSAAASYSRSESTLAELRGMTSEDTSVGVVATWNIFELGKFYKRKSAGLAINVSERKLDESKRQLLLDLQKTYQDFLTAAENIKVAERQLAESEHNYAQAFGEYKVGKGDILSLVAAERLLASAREQLTTSRLNLILAKALLERVAGIDSLETMAPQSLDAGAGS